MESHQVSDRAAAEAQLTALRSQRAALAERAVQPWWYDALLGLLVFQLIASYSFEKWVTAVAAGVLVVGCAGLVSAYRRIAGFWISGLRPGRTRRAIRVWACLYAVVLGAAAAAEFLLDVRYAMVAGGAVLGVGIAVTSRWWTRIYVAELRGEL